MEGRKFSVDLDDVELPSGRVTERIKVHHPDAVAILPFVADDKVLLVRQWRYSIGRETLEIPAGKVEPGEDLLECVRRELIEETGHDADNIEHLLSYAPAIGYSAEILHIFKGHALKRTSGHRIDSDEISKVEILSIDDLKERIKRNEIYDGKTIIALAMTSGFP